MLSARIPLLLILTGVVLGCQETDTPVFTDAAREAADGIQPGQLMDWVQALSDDELRGRGPGTEGDAAARAYLADELAALGYAPAAEDGSWEQPFELVGITAEVPDTWTFARDGESLDLARWDEFIAASGVQSPSAMISNAEVVFAGYGIEAPEYDWDDFKGADLEGKVLLMLNNDPNWDPQLFEGETRLYYGRWTYKYESAARQGAAAAIVIHTTPSAGYPWQVVQTSWTGEQFELPAGDEPRIWIDAWVTEDAARELVAMAGEDLDALTQAARSRDFEPVPLGITTSLRLRNTIHRTESANVLGMLEGSDPELSDEVVVYTAHHDHLGMGEADDTGDRIYNGARDNASGVAAVLGIARAFTELPEPPRRSILVALVGAEEQGLLGSKYLARNPPVPPGRMAANINYDSSNIWGPTRDITYVGKGKSTLDGVAARVAEHQNRVVQPDQFPDRGMFYRSDQFSLARVGVPALYLRPGTDFIDQPEGWGRRVQEQYEENDYHQPSDEVTEDWDLSGLALDARFGFWAGLIIASQDHMPRWNAGDEFEDERKAALAEVE